MSGSIFGGAGAFRGRHGKRDTMRQRSYDAENSTSMMDRREFGKAPSTEVCQRFVDSVLKRPWLIKEYGKRTITVTHNGGKGGSRAGGRMMYMSTYNRHKLLLLHELAHCLTPKDVGHGRAWARCYLMLVTRVMGKADGAELRKAFRKYGVKTREVTAADRERGRKLAALAKAKGHGGTAALAAHREKVQREKAALTAAGFVQRGRRGEWYHERDDVWMTREAALAWIDDGCPPAQVSVWIADPELSKQAKRANMTRKQRAEYYAAGSVYAVAANRNERAEYLAAHMSSPTVEPVTFAGAYWPE